MRAAVLLVSMAVCSMTVYGSVPAQEPGQQAVEPGMFAGAQRVAGEVISVEGATLKVKAADGATSTIVTTSNTRVMRGRGVSVKLADLKPGDGVMAVGKLEPGTQTLHAMFVVATDAAEMAKLRAELGKSYIVGKVTAVDADALRLTVERPDNVSQVIGVDESTSFRRGRGGRGVSAGSPAAEGRGTQGDAAGAAEPITFADIKVGDTLAGRGAVKNGTFMATELTLRAGGERRRQRSAADSTAGSHP